MREIILMTVDELIKILEKDPSKTLAEHEDEIREKGKIIGIVPDGMDGDLLTGELRESGFRVKNINEELRRKEKEG